MRCVASDATPLPQGGATPNQATAAGGLPRLSLTALAVAALALPVVAAALLPGEERVLLFSVVLFVAGGLGLLAHIAVLVLRAAGIRLLGVTVGPMVVRWDERVPQSAVM